MNAKIKYAGIGSDEVVCEEVLNGVKSLDHARIIANHFASIVSISHGEAVYVSTIFIDSENFEYLPNPVYFVEESNVTNKDGLSLKELFEDAREES